MTDARKKVQVYHDLFDWGEVEGATLTQAGEYLLRLARLLPDDATIKNVTNSYDFTEIVVVSSRDETDEEYAARKEQEEAQAQLEAERQQKKAAREKKEAEYQRLKRELGYC